MVLTALTSAIEALLSRCMKSRYTIANPQILLFLSSKCLNIPVFLIPTALTNSEWSTAYPSWETHSSSPNSTPTFSHHGKPYIHLIYILLFHVYSPYTSDWSTAYPSWETHPSSLNSTPTFSPHGKPYIHLSFSHFYSLSGASESLLTRSKNLDLPFKGLNPPPKSPYATDWSTAQSF